MMEERPNIIPSFADALKKNIFEPTDNENNNAVWGHIQEQSEEDAIKIAMKRSINEDVHKVHSRKKIQIIAFVSIKVYYVIYEEQ